MNSNIVGRAMQIPTCWAREAGYGCACHEGDPMIATPGYAEGRRHVDAGDMDALDLVIGRMRDRRSTLHIRYSDGEFSSILGAKGSNCDGQPYFAGRLGAQLARVLFALQGALGESVQTLTPYDGAVLIGGDWRKPERTEEWLRENDLLSTLPWCPSQVFVNGILSGRTMELLELIAAYPGEKVLVSNDRVAQVAPSLGATPYLVDGRNAYASLADVERSWLAKADSDALVIWAGGLGCKPAMSWFWSAGIGKIHLDVGCLFDGAVGLNSRGWLRQPPEDERLAEYRRRYVPFLRKEIR